MNAGPGGSDARPARFDLLRASAPGIRTLRFVPADRKGVLTPEALESLRGHLEALSADRDLRLAVLEGARHDLFAAGADLESIAVLTPHEAVAFAELGRAAFAAWEALGATTVAVVEGACFGGALDLVLSSDLIVALPNARFAHPGAQRGIITGWGGTARARERLSPTALRELFLEAEPVPAERALANGLVDVLLPDRTALDEHLSRWAGPHGDVLRCLKEVSRATLGLPVSRALVVEERLADLYRTAPVQSGA